MFKVHKLFVLQALCLSICCSSPFNLNKEAVQESLEQVLRILNPNKVPNSVLGKLERNMEDMNNKQIYTDEQDCNQPYEVLPEYTETILDFPKRELRQLESQKHYPICHLERRIHRLNTNVYEYRPAYYEEVRCLPNDVDVVETNEICSSLGFSCVQWNKTIHLTRRRFSSDCWETKTMVIPAGCECMWPVKKLGDMGSRT